MAKEMDYKPNNLAISLRKNKVSNVIGVVIPVVNHYFFSTVLKGIMTKAHAHNYLVIVGESVHNSKKEKEILEEFMDYGISGILLAPCLGSDFSENLLPIIHRRIPVVVMDRLYDNYNGNYVLTEDKSGAYIAVRHLIEMGYQRIAHIGSTDSSSVGLERKNGYLSALRDHGMTIDESYIELVDLMDINEGIQNGYERMASLMSCKVPPDAVFTVTDDVALGVYQYARDHGIKIPDELGVVGFSNSKVSKYLSPSLSTVEQNGEAMGNLAFDYFMQALHTNGMVYQKKFQSDLIVRQSSMKSTINGN